MTDDEMVGWHHRLKEHEFEPTQGDREGQKCLAGCSSWGHKELGTTQQLNKDIMKSMTNKTVSNCSYSPGEYVFNLQHPCIRLSMTM